MHSSPAIAYGKVYYPTDQGRIRALRLTDGKPLWEAVTPDSSQIWSSPAVAAGILYVTTYSGKLYAYCAETGVLLGSYSVPGYIHSSPAIAGNFLYFGGSDGNLYAFGTSAPEEVASVADHRPENHSLSQNYPNPFNRATTIAYSLPGDGHVTLCIFNLRGQEVKTLVDGDRESGCYRAPWNGENNEGRKVASGVYMYRLQVRDRWSEGSTFVKTRKLLFLQ
jgi:hypothetical protein